VIGVAIAGVFSAPIETMAQALKDVQTPQKPLVLKAQGSFFVGGEKAEQTRVELGGLGPGGQITVNQMYVRYMVPQGGDRNVPVVMVQIKTLATVPILVVFGDHRDTPTGISTRPSWQESFDSCQELIRRITAAEGQAQMLNPPDRGIRGNSHMIMQDKNNLQIADMILQWIDQRVRKRNGSGR
jgi:hypothetical protein